jgi:hypothetical protein
MEPVPRLDELPGVIRRIDPRDPALGRAASRHG